MQSCSIDAIHGYNIPSVCSHLLSPLLYTIEAYGLEPVSSLQPILISRMVLNIKWVAHRQTETSDRPTMTSFIAGPPNLSSRIETYINDILGPVNLDDEFMEDDAQSDSRSEASEGFESPRVAPDLGEEKDLKSNTGNV